MMSAFGLAAFLSFFIWSRSFLLSATGVFAFHTAAFSHGLPLSPWLLGRCFFHDGAPSAEPDEEEEEGLPLYEPEGLPSNLRLGAPAAELAGLACDDDMVRETAGGEEGGEEGEEGRMRGVFDRCTALPWIAACSLRSVCCALDSAAASHAHHFRQTTNNLPEASQINKADRY